MNDMSSIKNSKSKKYGKPSRSGIGKSDLELPCKFRGRYDLNKKKGNKEISLENAVNLFDVINQKKNTNFENMLIKMDTNKRKFSFTDSKSLLKVQHNIEYDHVSKFFVFNRDPSMIIMGVCHKNHRWFLVFQFQNKEDLKKFCDEIEGTNHKQIDPKASFVLEPKQTDRELYNDDEIQNENFEIISIHSTMHNDDLQKGNDLYNSYYEPDLLPETIAFEEASQTIISSRASSKNSNENENNDNVHCDNIGQSKLSDLLIIPQHSIYGNSKDWDEGLICMDETPFNKTGPIYMYCARRQVWYNHHNSKKGDVNFQNHELKNNIEDNFTHHEPKETQSENGVTDTFCDHEPKVIQSRNKDEDIFNQNENDIRDTFCDHEPKVIQSRNKEDDNVNQNEDDIRDTFCDHEPKVIPSRNKEEDNFNNYQPKLIQKNNSDDLDTFCHHEPKAIQTKNKDNDIFNHHAPKLIANEDITADHFCDHAPKMVQTKNKIDDKFSHHEPKLMQNGEDFGDIFCDHDPKMIF